MTEIFDNIRKLYHFADPLDEFSPYIEFFSETNIPVASALIKDLKFTVKLFPSFTPTIWLNLGSPYQLYNCYKSFHVDERTDVLILRNTVIERRNAPTDNIFTIKFFPGGFEAIFGISQSSIANEVIPLQEIIPEKVIQAIKNSPDFLTRISLWQEYFSLRKGQCKDSHNFQSVTKAIGLFQNAGMKLSINQLAQHLHLSDKTLNRYFNSVIGTGPKNYLNTLRARTAVTAFLNKSEPFSPLSYGYYDMSHFYRDAVRFTGAVNSPI